MIYNNVPLQILTHVVVAGRKLRGGADGMDEYDRDLRILLYFIEGILALMFGLAIFFLITILEGCWG